MDPVTLSRPLVNQLLTQAQQQPQAEVCGLIGRDPLRGTSHCYPVSNRADDPLHRYTLDPAEQIDARRRMRERGEDLFAIYHSHPQTAPLPSPTDLRLAQDSGVLYLIISLATTGVLQMRAFTIDHRQGRADEVPLEIE